MPLSQNSTSNLLSPPFYVVRYAIFICILRCCDDDWSQQTSPRVSSLIDMAMVHPHDAGQVTWARTSSLRDQPLVHNYLTWLNTVAGTSCTANTSTVSTRGSLLRQTH
eukprot:GHRR01024981.1.p1 GENE.GHRR01024981.1~~GHRR01024981.1.p1  ORF type:complete len:108 (+),score=10.55 GHRR01024981.1:722-1045(+)